MHGIPRPSRRKSLPYHPGTIRSYLSSRTVTSRQIAAIRLRGAVRAELGPAPKGATHLAVDPHRALLGPSTDRESVQYAYRFEYQEGQVSLEATTRVSRGPQGCQSWQSGFFGTEGFYTVDGGPEGFKIPHLRNAYQKVGMFRLATRPGIPTDDAFLGDQVRGYGFNHDGSIPTIFNFASVTTNGVGFDQSPTTPGGFEPGAAGALKAAAFGFMNRSG
jgi:hypothetical protein